VIFFTTDPTRPTAQRGFPFGVEEVFAQWEYRNMREGVAVRREWIRDQEEIWLVREENWDFARYGADGTIADVSVFDREGGLDPGRYTLRLYIDGVAQFAGGDNWAEDSSFVILDPNKRAGAYPSPGAEDSQVAILEAPGTLLLRACAGCPEEALITTPEIREIVWFPDNQHILYTIVDRSEQIYAPATIGIRFELWIVDVLSGEKEQLRGGTPWAPAVAPDGRTIAVMEGSGWCDAGECDLTLVFLQLDENLQPSASIGLDAFTFDPANSFGWDMFPVDQPDLPAPGAWESATVFRSGLYQTLDATFQGIYLFDLSTLVARRVGELAPLDSMDAPG
jgi:hypothetical protein